MNSQCYFPVCLFCWAHTLQEEAAVLPGQVGDKELDVVVCGYSLSWYELSLGVTVCTGQRLFLGNVQSIIDGHSGICVLKTAWGQGYHSTGGSAY